MKFFIFFLYYAGYEKLSYNEQLVDLLSGMMLQFLKTKTYGQNNIDYSLKTYEVIEQSLKETFLYKAPAIKLLFKGFIENEKTLMKIITKKNPNICDYYVCNSNVRIKYENIQMDKEDVLLYSETDGWVVDTSKLLTSAK